MDFEHRHAYGIMDYYFMTGDESIKESISLGITDFYTSAQGNLGDSNTSTAIRPNNAQYINARSTGGHLLWAARYACSSSDSEDRCELGNGRGGLVDQHIGGGFKREQC